MKLVLFVSHFHLHDEYPDELPAYNTNVAVEYLKKEFGAHIMKTNDVYPFSNENYNIINIYSKDLGNYWMVEFPDEERASVFLLKHSRAIHNFNFIRIYNGVTNFWYDKNYNSLKAFMAEQFNAKLIKTGSFHSYYKKGWTFQHKSDMIDFIQRYNCYVSDVF